MAGDGNKRLRWEGWELGACLSYIVTPCKAGKRGESDGEKRIGGGRENGKRDRVDKGRGGRIMGKHFSYTTLSKEI